MRHPHLRGKRYGNWARRSDVTQTESIGDQLDVCNNFADEHEMLHVKDFKCEGTGSIPGARDDIEDVLAEATAKGIEVLLFHDITRLTRSGVEHGMKVLYDIKSKGIEAVFVRDDVPGGEWAGIFQTLLLFAANQSAKKNADASARTSQAELEANKITHAKLTPYGLDRMVFGPDGTEQFRVRNKINGDQERMTPDGNTVIETFVRDENGKRRFYSKQKSETVYLVPGEQELADRVRWIYSRHFLDGMTPYAIRRELNAQGVPSARGLKWSKGSVTVILRNPVYTGRGLANSYTNSVYATRNPGAPRLSKVDFKTLVENKRPPRSRRPESEWFWREEPHLKDFLPADLKIVAEEFQRNYRSRIKDGHKPKPGGRPTIDSSFVLSSLIHLPDERPLKGHPNHGRRAYTTKYVEGIKRHLIPADPLEKAVLAVLRDVILSEPDLRKQVRDFVEQEVEAVVDLRSNIDRIRFEQKRLLTKISFLMDRVASSAEVKELTEQKIRESEAELGLVNRELKRASGDVPAALSDAEGAVKAVLNHISQLGRDLSSQAPDSVRRVVSQLVEKLVIDPDTYEIDMSLKLPSTVAWAAYQTSGSRCPVPPFDPKCRNSTEHTGVALGAFKCVSNGGKRYGNVCWTCCRARKSAPGMSVAA